MYQGTADECLMILAHLWTWDILHHTKNFYDHGIQKSFGVRKQLCDMSTLDELAISI